MWLTMAADAYSSAVLGLSVTMGLPSADSVATFITPIVIGRRPWWTHAAATHPIGAFWGLPGYILLDSAFESQLTNLLHRCENAGVSVIWCAPTRPDLKDELERLFYSIHTHISQAPRGNSGLDVAHSNKTQERRVTRIWDIIDSGHNKQTLPGGGCPMGLFRESLALSGVRLPLQVP